MILKGLPKTPNKNKNLIEHDRYRGFGGGSGKREREREMGWDERGERETEGERDVGMEGRERYQGRELR